MKKKMFIHFIMDESSSMFSSQQATIDGFNKYIEEQKENKDVDILISLTKFSTNVSHVFYARTIADVPPLNKDNYSPNGSTALRDAVGLAIQEADKSLVRESGSDYSFLFVVFTDGEENSSRQFSQSQIQEMVQGKEAMGWKFVFFGTDISAWDTGSSLGIGAANSMNVSRGNTGMMFSALSRSTRCATSQVARGINMADSFFSANQADYDNIDQEINSLEVQAGQSQYMDQTNKAMGWLKGDQDVV